MCLEYIFPNFTPIYEENKLDSDWKREKMREGVSIGNLRESIVNKR